MICRWANPARPRLARSAAAIFMAAVGISACGDLGLGSGAAGTRPQPLAPISTALAAELTPGPAGTSKTMIAAPRPPRTESPPGNTSVSGAAAYPPPDTPYVVGAGQRYPTVQAAIDAAPEGAVIYLRNGTYREEARPKSRQTLQGETRDGARIDGANAIDPGAWRRDGPRWYFQDPWPLRGHIGNRWDGQTPDVDALAADTLHRDDIPLLHKKSLAAVGPDDFWIDYGTRRVYTAANPAGKRFELSVRRVGIGDGNRSVTGVTIQNLTVEKTATFFNEGGVEMSSGWTIKDCLVLGHHGRGVQTSVDDTIVGTKAPFVNPYPGGGVGNSAQTGQPGSMQIMYSGNLGVGGSFHIDGPDRFGTESGGGDQPPSNYSNNIKIAQTEIGWSNVGRYSYMDEGGGLKLLFRKDVLVDGVWVHGSYGPGIWFDTNNRDIEVRGSLLEDNFAAGLWYEANPGPNTGGIHAHHNTFRRNGNTPLGMNRDFDRSGQFSGIFISDSADMGIDDNYVEVGRRGGFGIAEHYGARTHPANLNIQHNVISIGIPTAAMGFAAGGPNFQFDYNKYLTWGQVNPGSRLFSLGGDTFTAWQALGRDPHGTIVAVAAPP